MDTHPVCGCRMHAKVYYSWTESNPGRRFAKCRQSRTNMSCRFWKWMDPPLTAHYRDVINGFIQTQDILKDEIAELKAKVARLEGDGNAQPVSDTNSFNSEVEQHVSHPTFTTMHASSESIMESVVEASACQTNGDQMEDKEKVKEWEGSEFLFMMIFSIAVGLIARFVF